MSRFGGWQQRWIASRHDLSVARSGCQAAGHQ